MSLLNQRTLIGAAILDIGWGIVGVCPGPAIAGVAAGNRAMLIALVGMFTGAYVQGRYTMDAGQSIAGIDDPCEK